MRKSGARGGGAKTAEADGTQCNGCGSAFSLFNWKHHCRRCGKAFCDACTKDRAVLSGPEFGKDPQRVCHPCKVAERRTRLDGKRGGRRGVAPPDEAEAGIDLGLGADPLGGAPLGEPLSARDLQDPLVAATLEDVWFGGTPQGKGSDKKAKVSPGSSGAVARRGSAAPAAPRSAGPSPGGSPEGGTADAVQAEKRRAVALHKAGKADEALQALRHAHEMEAQADGGGAKRPGAGPRKGRSMFDVSDEDMADPDLLAQLADLGWTDDAATKKARKQPAAPPAAAPAAAAPSPAGPSAEKQMALEAEIVEHKKRALALRKAGRLDEWRDEMGLAAALQAQLEQQPQQPTPPPQPPQRAAAVAAPRRAHGRGDAAGEGSSEEEQDPDIQAALRQLGFDKQQDRRAEGGGGGEKGRGGTETLEEAVARRKREALACKRAGDIEGARAAMKEAKQLEAQLEAQRGGAALRDDAQSQPQPQAQPQPQPQPQPQQRAVGAAGSRTGRRAAAAVPRAGGADADPEVTSEDEQDPEILAALRDMGWQDEHSADSAPASRASLPAADGAELRRSASVREAGERLGALVGAVEDIVAQKAALERDVLAHKRAALARKRAGDMEGAKDELRQAKLIERRLEEAEEAEAAGLQPLDMLLRAGHNQQAGGAAPDAASRRPDKPLAAIMAEAMHSDDVAVPEVDSDDEKDPEILAQLAEMGWQEERSGRASGAAPQGAGTGAPAERVEALAGQAAEVVARKEALQAEVMAQKRQALALKRAGDVEGAKAALAHAKELERQLERGEEQEAAGAGALGRVQQLGARSAGGNTGGARAGGGGPVDLAQVGRLLEAGEPEVAVTEDDEQDPDILAALKEMGWQEEPPTRAAPPVAAPRPAPQPRTPEELLKEAGALKRRALGLRKAGQLDEWRATLQQAHAFEEQAQQTATPPPPAAPPAEPMRGDTRATASRRDGGAAERVPAVPPAPPNPVQQGQAPVALSWPTGPWSNEHPGLTPVSAGPLPADLFSSIQESSLRSTSQAGAAPGQESRAASSDSSSAGRAVRQSSEGEARADPRPGTTGISQEGALHEPRFEDSAIGGGGRPDRAVGSTGRPAMGSPQSSGRSDSDGPGAASRRSSGEGATSAPPAYWPESSPEAVPAARPSTLPSERRASGSASGGPAVAGLQEQIRAGKQAAVRLKREGRLQEARAALLQTREWERELAAQEPCPPAAQPSRMEASGAGEAAESAAEADGGPAEEDEEVSVEDAFDPDIVAALKGLGWSEEQIRGRMVGGPGRAAAKPGKAAATGLGGGSDRGQLEERIREEKRRAVELKRAGRQQEALAVLREVKQLEKQLA